MLNFHRINIIVWSAVFIVSLSLLVMKGLDRLAVPEARGEQVVFASAKQSPPPHKRVKVSKIERKAKAKRQVIVLSKDNTLSLRGPVDSDSMAKLSTQMLDMSERLRTDDVIYLVLDTPGGDVNAGNKFLDAAEALPQKVRTISIQSVSMGFHIAQRLDQRLITPSGMMMSHRVSVGGMSGQVGRGELESRVAEIQRIAFKLDVIASDRMNIPVEDYRELIRDEYYISGQDAVDQGAADAVVLVRCDETLSGSHTFSQDSLFGPVTVTENNCPVL